MGQGRIILLSMQQAFFPADLKHAHNIQYSKSSWTKLTCHHHAHQTNKPQMNSIFFVLLLGSLVVIGVSTQPGLFSVLDIYPGTAWDLFKQFLGSKGQRFFYFPSRRGLKRIPYLCTYFLGWFLKQMFSVHADIVYGIVCAYMCIHDYVW